MANEKKEEIILLEPIIEEEEIIDLEEDAGLWEDNNNTCGSNCGN